jgi:serine/threonine protein kinase/WD40 repeat protein/tetratricopeptide (TPR) repeat protein
MTEPGNESEAIFNSALDRADPGERARFLEQACAGRPQLLQRVRELLAGHDASHGPLDAPPPGVDQTVAADQAGDRPGGMIGHYKVLQVIGEGGMGTVYMAEQTAPVRRKVALKVIKPGMDSARVLARFEAERQALALMDHPNIAKVFDGGATPEGRPYFVMELVKGQPITQYCDGHRLTPRQRIELLVPVCQAVQHAHQKGIIHRDLKPTNVLVAPYDGRPVVKVIDFGVAKAAGQRLTERTLFTEFGAVIGTLEYMSPEQAELNNQDIDTRSDVYSLGVLLYELLTGTTPLSRRRLTAAAFTEMLRLIREEDPPRPSTRLTESKETLPSISAKRQTEPARLTRLVRGELDWIVMKSLDKDRTRRYETANGLAMDLQRYLADEPVQACPPSASYRLRKVVRRNKKLLATAAGFVLVLLAGTALSLWQAVRATESESRAKEDRDRAETAGKNERVERDNAQAAKDKALAADAENRRTLARQYVATGARLLEQGNRTDALVWFVEALRKDVADEERVAMHRRRIAAVAQLCPRPEQLWFHPGPVTQALFSPDGRRVLTVCGKEARVWDVASGRLVGSASTHTADIKHVAFNSDGSRYLTFCHEPLGLRNIIEGEARVWDTETGRALTPPLAHSFATPVNVLLQPTFSPDGRWLLTLSGRKLESIPDPQTGAIWRHRMGGAARVWDAASGRPVTPPLTLEGGALEAEFSPDGSRVYAADGYGRARLWEAATGQPVSAVLTHGEPQLWRIRTHSFGADGKELFLCFENTSPAPPAKNIGSQRVVAARGWNAVDGQPLGEAHNLAGVRLAFGIVDSIALDGRRILVAPSGVDGRLFDALTGQPIGEPLKLDPALSVLGPVGAGPLSFFLPGGSRVLLTYRPPNQVDDQSRGEARVWDTSNGRPVSPPMMLGAPASTFSFSRDGQHLLIVEGPATARVWETSTGRPLTPLIRHQEQNIRAVLSPGGEYLLTAAGSEARVWDVATGRPLTPLLPHNGHVQAAWFNPEVTHVLTAGQDGTARLWPLTAGSPPTHPITHDSPVARAAFIPDGHTVFSVTGQVSTGGMPSAGRLWDAGTGRPRSPALPFTARVYGSAEASGQFSPDGRWLAFWRDRDVQLWDVEAARAAGEPLRHDGSIVRAEFTPDSKGLLTVWGPLKNYESGGSKATIWDIATRRIRFEPIVTPQGYTSLHVSPDGSRFLFGIILPKPRVQFWDSQTGRAIGANLDLSGPAAFSPDSKYLAAQAPGQGVRVIDAISGRPTETSLAHQGPIQSVLFPTGSQSLLVVGIEELRRWDLASGRQLGPTLRYPGAKMPVISADGRFAFRLDGPEVHILDLTTGRPAGPPVKHAAHVASGRFTPDGRVLFTLSGATIIESHGEIDNDRRGGKNTYAVYHSLGELRLWDARSGELLAPPLDHVARGWGSLSQCPELSSDGRRVLLSGDQRTIEPWEIPCPDPRPEDELVTLAQALSGRRFDEVGGPTPMSADEWAAVRGRVADVGVAGRFDSASWNHQRILRCIDARKFSSALPHVERFIAARPDEWRGYYYRARCRSELGDQAGSLADNTRAIELGAEDYRCWNNRGLAYWRLDRFAEAAADYDKVVTSFPDSANYGHWVMLVQCRAWMGDLAGYRRACAGLIDKWGTRADPNRLAWLCSIGPDALPDPGRVVALAEKAYEQSPTADVRNTLGAALYRAGKWEEAVRVLDQNHGAAAAADWLFLAMAHFRLGHAEAARAHWNRAVTWLDQDQPTIPYLGRPADDGQREDLRTLLREAEVTLRVPAERIKARESLLKQRPQDRARVQRLVQDRQWAEAVAVLDGLITRDAGYRLHWLARGDARFELGDYEKAAADYAHALELLTTPDDLPGTAFRLAVLRVHLGETEGYRRLCSDLLEQLPEPGYPHSAYLLARVCALGPGGLTDHAPAIRLAKRAVADNSKAPEYLHALGAVYFRAGQHERAIEALRESMAVDPKWAAQVCNWQILARAYQALGRPDEARPWSEKARVWLDGVDPKAPEKSLGPISGLHAHDALACQLLRREAVPKVQK